MGSRILKYSFVTIGLYLGLSLATGAGKLLKAGDSAGVDVIKAFQGR